MAISDNQKVDYLWKKIGYALTKTDTNTQKKAPNESIPSPLQIRGDKVMKQSSSIPGVIPGSTSGVVTLYPTSNPVECDADITATPNRSWKTNLENWISPEFGSTYQVKVYIHDTGDAANATTGDQVFATGTGNDDEWFFDYQSGVLHFIGDNLPDGVSFTGKTVYISGARYTGEFGVGGDLGDFVFTDNEMSLLTATDSIVMDSVTGLVLPTGATGDRSTAPQQGEIRFNSTSGEVEVYTGSAWEGVGSGSSAATFDSEELTGDGSTVTFTLQQTTTTDAIIVVTGGIVQNPGVGYTVSGDQITFAEAPIASDEVVVRYIAASRVVTGLYSPDTTNSISVLDNAAAINMNGTDVISVSDTTVTITGDIVPATDVTYDLGSTTKKWNELHLAGSTIYLGNLQLKDNGDNTFGVYQSDGSTEASINVSSEDAAKWTTARTITLAGDLTGNVSIDGSANVTLTAAVVDDSHNHTIANVDGLSTALASAETDAVTTANAYTDTRETAITTAYQTYADTAESDAITSSNSYTDTAVANLVASAPSTLDTLNELAAALGDDPNFATTVATDIGTKVAKTSNQALSTAANALTASNATITLARGDGTTDVVTVNNVANANACSGNAATADSVDTRSATANANHFLTFVDANNPSATAEIVYTDSAMYYNPATNILTVPSINGTASAANTVKTVSTESNNEYYLTFVDSNNGSALAESVYTDAGITYNPSTDTLTVPNIEGTASSAEYADLAERYRSDKAYPTGTVMAVGGDAEVTAATTALAHSVLGVISANPAYLMNKGLDGATIALKGRVPVRVEGQVNKGDRLAPSQTPGVATVDNTRTGWSFAIALESGTGIVEAVIL